MAKLAWQVDTTRPSLLNYLDALEKAHAILLLDKEAKGLKRLVKPEKVYLGNTNYAYAFSEKGVDAGNLRETFFFSQLAVTNAVTYTSQTDFLVDGKYSFEVGGARKARRRSKISPTPLSPQTTSNTVRGSGFPFGCLECSISNNGPRPPKAASPEAAFLCVSLMPEKAGGRQT